MPEGRQEVGHNVEAEGIKEQLDMYYKNLSDHHKGVATLDKQSVEEMLKTIDVLEKKLGELEGPRKKRR